MTVGQAIILYFEIIPILSFLFYAVIKSYIDEKKASKKKIWQFKKAYRRLNEKDEKQEFFIKNGLSAYTQINQRYM